MKTFVCNGVSAKGSSLVDETTGPKHQLRFTSSQLFGATREIVIEHSGSEYRLRITSNDKLILTK